MILAPSSFFQRVVVGLPFEPLRLNNAGELRGWSRWILDMKNKSISSLKKSICFMEKCIFNEKIDVFTEQIQFFQ